MFCTNCGQQIPDGSNVCPNCGAMLTNNAPANNQAPVNNQAPAPEFNQAPAPDMYQSFESNNVNPDNGANGAAAAPAGSLNTIALILGISGIAGSFLFGLLWGVPAALIFTLISAGGIVLAIQVKKSTNGAQGKSAFVCSIIGAALGFLMMIGCAACGSSCGDAGNYGCYGCVGGACKAKNDIEDAADELEDAWEKALKDLENYDWD